MARVGAYTPVAVLFRRELATLEGSAVCRAGTASCRERRTQRIVTILPDDIMRCLGTRVPSFRPEPGWEHDRNPCRPMARRPVFKKKKKMTAESSIQPFSEAEAAPVGRTCPEDCSDRAMTRFPVCRVHLAAQMQMRDVHTRMSSACGEARLIPWS